MRILLFACFLSSLIACQSNGYKAKTSSNTSKEDVSSMLRMVNKADYSTDFIEKLKNKQGKRRIYLNGNQMIVNERDTVYFPAYPPIGERIVLTRVKDDRAFALTVKRLNQTTIDYKVEIVDFGKYSTNEKGTADLPLNFYFGAEIDMDERMGNSYFSTEFKSENADCYTYIRLGHLEDNPNKALLGKLIKNCNDKIGDIDLTNCPVLVEK